MIFVLFHVFYYLLGKLVFRRYSNNSDEEHHEDNGFFSLSDREHEVIMDPTTTTTTTHNDNASQNDDIGAQAKAIKERTNLKRRDSDASHEEAKATIRFSPPAYIQRYQAVLNILTDKRYGGKLKKVVDFGCSELGFCLYLKNMVGVEEVLFVDIDKPTLEMYKEKARPLHADYLHRRTSPLVFRIIEGSVTHHDKTLQDCDAVVCIELVEHLYPEPLTQLPNNIFGFIRPKVAIITTPNADFNVLFENMNGFRHPDHKFEWTRMQFEEWANNIVSRFPEYEVEFHGICNGPPGTEHLGACSQMAVFHKSNDLQVDKINGHDGLYNPIAVYEYPYEIDNRSDEEKILDDAVFYIRKFSINDEELTEEFPLDKLLSFMKNFYISSNYLREVLENANWTVEDRESGPVVLVPPPSSFSDQSMNEDDFMDNDYPPGYYDWDEEPPGPPADYFDQQQQGDDIMNVVDEEDWENEPNFAVQLTESENQETENASFDTEILENPPPIQQDNMCFDDTVTESYSREPAIAAVDENILKSNFSAINSSDNSVAAENSYTQAESTENTIAETNTLFFTPESARGPRFNNSENDSTDIFFSKDTSMCSMFLESTHISNDVHLEESTGSNLESTVTSPITSSTNKKLKLNNVNVNTFEEPKFTSSPHITLSFENKKRKVAKQRMECSSTTSANNSTEDIVLCENEESNILQNNDDSNTCSNESMVVTRGYSPHTNDFESQENARHYTGTIPKTFYAKISDTKANAQREIKLDRSRSPDILEMSPPNSYSPEIMDSGYPNSNSPPDLSPEYDLSSIAHDHTSGSVSPSIADIPRIGFFDMAENDNIDLANNNLDGEGNNIEAEENQHIDDLQPLINVLENDIQNENDIYIVEDNFPMWLLRILQRLDADAIGINNLPRLQRQNENFVE